MACLSWGPRRWWPRRSARRRGGVLLAHCLYAQHGKEVAARYLAAASQTFTGDATEPGHAGSAADTGFHYTKTVMAGHTAIMEFETTMQGKYINGVDIIVCNDEGRIIEFRVLIRPLQAVNVVHEQMAAMLGSMPESH